MLGKSGDKRLKIAKTIWFSLYSHLNGSYDGSGSNVTNTLWLLSLSGIDFYCPPRLNQSVAPGHGWKLAEVVESEL